MRWPKEPNGLVDPELNKQADRLGCSSGHALAIARQDGFHGQLGHASTNPQSGDELAPRGVSRLPLGTGPYECVVTAVRHGLVRLRADAPSAQVGTALLALRFHNTEAGFGAHGHRTGRAT